MPSSYTIEQLGQKAVWENDANKGDYPAILSGVEGEVLVFHDSSSDFDPPKVGDQLFGDVSPDKRGNPRFRRARRESAPGGHRPRGGSGGGGYSKGDIARITRSHSQEMALRLLAMTNDITELDLSNKADAGAYLNGVVRKLADWFDVDVQAAEQRVAAPQQTLGEEVPADRTGLNGNPDDQIPF